MKFNIANPVTGCQKTIVIDDEKRVAIFYDKRMGAEVNGDDVGEQYKGYVFKITGGQDKDGFAMKQGVLVKGRVRLLLSKENHATFRPKRDGMKKRKSVRGCIIGSDLAVINLAIVKTGEQDIEGLTTERKPRRLGPKRANHIRKLFNLKKDDDVRLYVVRREVTSKSGKTRTKAPKIQRLITEERLRRKRVFKAEKKERWQRRIKAIADYQKVITEHKKRQAAHKAKKEEEKTTGKVAPVDPKTVKKTDTKAVDTKKTTDTKKVADTKKVDPKTTTKTTTTTTAAPAKKTTKK